MRKRQLLGAFVTDQGDRQVSKRGASSDGGFMSSLTPATRSL